MYVTPIHRQLSAEDGEPRGKRDSSADFRGESTAVVSVENIVDASALEAVVGSFDLSLKCEDGVVVRAHCAVITPNFSTILEALTETGGNLNASDEIVCVMGASRAWELIKHRLYEPYLPDGASGDSEQQLLKQVRRHSHGMSTCTGVHCTAHCIPWGDPAVVNPDQPHDSNGTP